MLAIQILKHDWPARWQGFIPDLVSAAKTSETICENCMAILKVRPFIYNFGFKFVSFCFLLLPVISRICFLQLLSEEVFDFSRGEMTQQKIKELKQSLNR